MVGPRPAAGDVALLSVADPLAHGAAPPLLNPMSVVCPAEPVIALPLPRGPMLSLLALTGQLQRAPDRGRSGNRLPGEAQLGSGQLP
ncbi:MAG: hypothetical protein ACRDRR_04060 [Pseudonocardiaceae bacterium]